MQAVIDLNPRQASRVLEQALRVSAVIELEPRTHVEEPLRGKFTSRDGELLRVDLNDDTRVLPLHLLVGAYCDVRLVLSGQLYLFSTCIVDIIDHGNERRLIVREPETLHVANRRRFERRTLAEFSQVRLWPGDSTTPYIGELCNISSDGLACRMIRGELDEILLVGDEVRVCFDLPGSGDTFDLPAAVCGKNVTRDGQQLLVGLEFRQLSTDPVTKLAIDRLHAALCELTANLSDPDGE